MRPNPRRPRGVVGVFGLTKRRAMTVEKHHLVRPTSFRAYHEGRLGKLEELPELIRQRFLEQEAQLAAEMHEGDELWEWQVGGSVQAPEVSGLAILRQGEILRSWECYRACAAAPG